MGGRENKKIPGSGVHVVELPPGLDEEFFVQAYRSQPEVEFAELDMILPPDDMVPDDPSYPNQWHLPIIASPRAWSTTTGNDGVVIAILDTGVDASHPDLASKLVPGWNVYNNNSDTSDVYGHGTAVAGTAAASSNNTQGVASVAWDCKIMPVRISDLNGFAYTSTVVNGLTWAADHGARVANISYKYTTSFSVTSAAQYFQSKGGVVVISAGNDRYFDPSSDNPYVLTVSATNTSDTIAGFSNTGNNIDLSAPGIFIETTNRGGGYGSWSGTSFSAPIVAGAAALVLSVNPGLNPDLVQNVLKQSADDLGAAGWDPTYGSGRVNAANAVTLAAGAAPPPLPPPPGDTTAPSVAITSPANGASVAGKVNVSIKASDDMEVAKVELYIDGALVSTSRSASFNYKWDVRKISRGQHTLVSKAYDRAGNAGTSATVVVYR